MRHSPGDPQLRVDFNKNLKTFSATLCLGASFPGNIEAVILKVKCPLLV